MPAPLQPRFPEQRDFIGRLVREAYAWLLADVTVEIDKRHPGVTVAQNQVMVLIDADGTRPAELARRAQVTRQSMAEALAGLEDRGYIELRPDPSDGRAKIATLTAKGKAGLRDGLAAALAVHQEWEAAIGEQKMARLMTLLRELLTALEHRPG